MKEQEEGGRFKKVWRTGGVAQEGKCLSKKVWGV
jgi:hypothetical protein